MKLYSVRFFGDRTATKKQRVVQMPQPMRRPGSTPLTPQDRQLCSLSFSIGNTGLSYRASFFQLAQHGASDDENRSDHLDGRQALA